MKMISVSGEWFFRRVGPLLQSLPRRPPAPVYQTRTHGGDRDDGDSTGDGDDGDSTGDGGDGNSTGTHGGDGDSTGDGGDGVPLYQAHMVHRWEQ